MPAPLVALVPLAVKVMSAITTAQAVGGVASSVGQKAVESVQIPRGPNQSFDSGKLGTAPTGSNSIVNNTKDTADALKLLIQKGIKSNRGLTPKGSRG